MKKIALFSIIALFCVQFSEAQTAAQTIDKLITSVKTTAIRTDFVLKIKEKAAKTPQTITGVFTMKGEKFIMEMNETKVYFNGKTQWTYTTESNEVTITEPTDIELAEINPIAILYSFRATCDIKFSSQKSATSQFIDLLPKDPKSDITKIVVETNKNTIISLQQIAKNGDTVSLTFNNFRTNVSVKDSDFSFNPQQHKDIIINDLR